jgi:predicted porin
MKKKILMTAVVAAMAIPMVAAAEATIYGKLHMSADDIDYGDSGRGVNLASDGYCRRPGADGADVCSRASRLGFKGSEDLGSGLKAIYKVEFGVQMADGDGNILGEGSASTVSGRDMYLGLAGDWGTALIGRMDTPFKMQQTQYDIFSDQIADMNFTAGFQDFRTDNAIAYISPAFAGFTVAAAIVQPGAAGATFSSDWNAIAYKADALTSPIGNYGSTLSSSSVTTKADSWADAWSLAGMYKNGPFTASLGYESVGKDVFCWEGNQGCRNPWNNAKLDDWDKWGAGFGYSTDMFTVNIYYEDQLDFQQIWELMGKFNFGNNSIKAMYAQGNADSKGSKSVGRAVDTDSWALGYDYNFSKRTTAYVVYADKDVDGKKNFLNPVTGLGDGNIGDWDGWSIGMIHKF